MANQSLNQLPPSSKMVDDFIEHHGVKGMKWGVRKAGPSGGGSSSKPTRRRSADSKSATTLRKKKPFELSNEQLKKANERANLERNFRKLNPGKIKIGKEIAAGIIAAAGTAVTVYNMAHSPAGQAAIAAGKAALTKSKLVSAV